jgi:predicted permease
MGWWRRIADGLRTLLRRQPADAELDDEVRHFMEEAVRDRIARGEIPEAARRAVRLRYGDPLTAREDVRSYGWEAWVDAVLGDVRLSLRGLRRSPGFTGVVVLTLGLGVGAATAIFSVVRPVLFEPLGYPQAERILSIDSRGDDGARVQSTFGTYLELANRSRAFVSLVAFKPWQPTLTGGSEPERLEGQAVSAAYFDVLAVRPALGAGFDPESDRPGGEHAVVLSDALWRSRFGADPAIAGRTVRLDGASYAVVGVMPEGFRNATDQDARIWTLLQYDPAPVSYDTREWGHHLDLVGRVRPGIDPDAARDDLEAIAQAPLADFPRPGWATMAQGFSVRTLRDATTADSRPAMMVVLGAVGLLLVVTCVNLVLLLLARGARRRGEFAMRAALGAGRGRLARYLLTESLVLSALGGLAGIGIAWIGVSVLVTLAPPTLPRLDVIALDGRALAFAAGLATLVGLLVGPTPGLHRAGGGPQAIREAGRGVARRGRAVRRVLVVTEVAMATVLLVGTGLILHSTLKLFWQPVGFDASGAAVAQVYGTGLERGDAATHRFFDQSLESVRALPGVVAAAWTSQLPLGGGVDVYGVTVADGTGVGGADGPAYRYVVSPGYFEAMGVRLLRGRALGEDDTTGAPPVAVVSASLARRLFQDADPIGRTFQFGAARPDPYTIVGVVDDVKQVSLASEDADAVYIASHQWHWADRVRWLVVRTADDPMRVVSSARRAIWSVDADQPVVRAQSLAGVVTRSEARRRFVLLVMAAFAGAATALAVIGLYGVVAGMVTERLPEMGVRAALGAPRQRIVGLVVRQGMALTGAGVLVGIVAATAVAETLTALLFQVSTVDAATYVAVASLLLIGAAAACVVPAVRAARVDPVRTLKAE